MSVQAISDPKGHPDSRSRRLEAWKEIASYLGRDVTTVRRWEKREGLPVHRLHHSRLGSVYAYTAELDAWRNERVAGAANGGMAATQAPQIVRRIWTVITVAALGLVLASGLAWLRRQRSTALPSGGSPVRSIVVLPLDNLSGNPEQDYLA